MDSILSAIMAVQTGMVTIGGAIIGIFVVIIGLKTLAHGWDGLGKLKFELFGLGIGAGFVLLAEPITSAIQGIF